MNRSADAYLLQSTKYSLCSDVIIIL